MAVDPNRTPEEEECLLKQGILAGLETELADTELELASFKADLAAFDAEYRRIVAPAYAAMERLQSDAAAIEHDDEPRLVPDETSCPPGELKLLFREVARSIHPDLASSDEQRRRRDELMAQANAAYASGNDTQLRELLLKWKADPHAVEGDDVVARLVRNIRLIAWVKAQIERTKQELKDLRKTDLNFLRLRAERARTEGRDLLQEVRANLDQQIQTQRERLGLVNQSSNPRV
jgi:septal ring factor EnvC (AmiA/AmiB activator)